MNAPILRPPETAPIPRLALRQAEAAIALGISDVTLRKWTAAGIVPHVRENGVVLYPVGALEGWLAERSARGEEA